MSWFQSPQFTKLHETTLSVGFVVRFRSYWQWFALYIMNDCSPCSLKWNFQNHFYPEQVEQLQILSERLPLPWKSKGYFGILAFRRSGRSVRFEWRSAYCSCMEFVLFLFASKIDEYDLNVWYCTELEAELDIKTEEGKCIKKEIRKAPFLRQKWGKLKKYVPRNGQSER